jgi:hypothetical protein
MHALRLHLIHAFTAELVYVYQSIFHACSPQGLCVIEQAGAALQANPHLTAVLGPLPLPQSQLPRQQQHHDAEAEAATAAAADMDDVDGDPALTQLVGLQRLFEPQRLVDDVWGCHRAQALCVVLLARYQAGLNDGFVINETLKVGHCLRLARSVVLIRQQFQLYVW